ncbi:hypothetical protein ACWFZ6_24250 [Methylorubrum extorquens]
MTATIGIRVYRVEFRQRGTGKPLSFTSELMEKHPRDFIEAFVTRNINIVNSREDERSWYFDRKKDNNEGIRGYVRYGTYGFESNLVDTETKQSNYRRKTTDVEEIPLYFDFWVPKNSQYCLVAFQSFQGRSCISLVSKKMSEDFERANQDCLMNFKKVMPSDLKGSLFYNAPIKKMTLIKNKSVVDPADKYLNRTKSEYVDIELSLCARRKKDLGMLGDWQAKMPANTKGLIEYAGIEFDEAVAEVNVGNRRRRVGVFGHNSDAGVIDITKDIDKGIDGHPTFASLKRETTNILGEFYRILSGSRK